MNKNTIIGFLVGFMFYSFAFALINEKRWIEFLVVILVITGSYLQTKLSRYKGNKKYE